MRRLAVLLVLILVPVAGREAVAGNYSDWENWMSSATAVRSPVFGERRFRNNVGGGFAYGPVYIGGTAYEFKPLPLLDTEFAGRLFVSTQQGVGYNIWRSRTSRIAPRITWDFGRDSGDDTALSGLPNIDPAVELGLYWETYLKSWRLRADVRQDIGDGHGGLLANGDVAVGGRWSEKASLIIGGRATYMDESYATSYFGTPSFTAESGLRDASAYAQLVYDLPGGFYLSGEFRATYLFASASDSPISETNNYFTGALLAGYRF